MSLGPRQRLILPGVGQSQILPWSYPIWRGLGQRPGLRPVITASILIILPSRVLLHHSLLRRLLFLRLCQSRRPLNSRLQLPRTFVSLGTKVHVHYQAPADIGMSAHPAHILLVVVRSIWQRIASLPPMILCTRGPLSVSKETLKDSETRGLIWSVSGQ